MWPLAFRLLGIAELVLLTAKSVNSQAGAMCVYVSPSLISSCGICGGLACCAVLCFDFVLPSGQPRSHHAGDMTLLEQPGTL